MEMSIFRAIIWRIQRERNSQIFTVNTQERKLNDAHQTHRQTSRMLSSHLKTLHPHITDC